MGLGKKGNNLLQADKGLFVKTEPENANAATHQTHQIRKHFMISQALDDKLREAAYTQRRKEVDIIREALEKYFAG